MKAILFGLIFGASVLMATIRPVPAMVTTPEPQSFLLIGLGLAAIGFAGVRRSTKR